MSDAIGIDVRVAWVPDPDHVGGWIVPWASQGDAAEIARYLERRGFRAKVSHDGTSTWLSVSRTIVDES